MYIGAIDIGGSKTIAGIVNENGELLIEKQIVTEKSDCAAHFNRCAALLLEAAAEYGVPAQALEGVGVSLPGMVDHSHSVLLLAPGAGWRDFPAAEFLREALGIRALWCENDVNNCARAELRFAGAPENFLWITVSTGIGGAVVADGRVLLGCNSLAGELGHCKVEFEHPLPCPCGSRGCLEAHASGAAPLPPVRPPARGGPPSRRPRAGTGRVPRRGGLRRARAGRVFAARALFDRAGGYLGQALAPVVSMLNPERVYFGGGVARSLGLLLPRMRSALDARAAESCAGVEIRATGLGYEASLLGAAALFLEQAQ